MEIEIKIATNTSEISAAKAIRQKVFVEEQSLPYNLEFDDKDEKSVHIIAVELATNKVVGICRFFKIDENICNISKLAVLNEYRGKNIAIAIMKFLENYVIP